MGGVLLCSLSNTSFFLQINSWLNWCWGRSRFIWGGQQWVLILLVPPSEIRSKSSPVTSETLLWSRRLQRESSRDLRDRKFWESCKFRKFPSSTCEPGQESSDLWRHHIHTGQQYEPEMFSYFLTLSSCTWAVNWLKIRVNRGMQSMVWWSLIWIAAYLNWILWCFHLKSCQIKIDPKEIKTRRSSLQHAWWFNQW